MLRYTINPKYSEISEFIISLPNLILSDGEMIHNGRNMIKSITAPNGIKLNVKRYHKPTWINAFVYSSGIRKPKGARAYEYSNILLDNEIETPESVAYIEDRRLGILGYSYYISIQCPYSHRLYELGDAHPSDYEPLGKALAAFAASMHDKGFLHRDFSPGNILWEKDRQGHYNFSVVDINRMYFGKVSALMGSRNFSRLWGPKRFIQLMVEEYANLRGANASQCLEAVMDERRKFWKRYMRKRTIEFKLEL